MADIRTLINLPERIASKIAESTVNAWTNPDTEETTFCQEFQGRIEKAGYGRVWFNGKPELVHRITCELFYGDAGEVTEHKCNNRACCNPLHLEPSNQKANVAYMIACGRLKGACAKYVYADKEA